ncbi:hypothetical protein OAK05_03495 [Gammaproteobacteria bacterium]|nr:hypothetical protein [Gammaproteobacteria bacterium]
MTKVLGHGVDNLDDRMKLLSLPELRGIVRDPRERVAKETTVRL